MSYRTFISYEIAESIRKLRRKDKERIDLFLNNLSANPFTKGDWQIEKEGREVELKIIGKYSLLFWADHAVKEVKVIEFYRS